MAAAATPRKRLPKELQDFRQELKGLSFKEKVKAYFDCAPYIRNIDSRKKVMITRNFSKDERGEFYRRYLPIYNAIDRYGDRIRAINGNRIIYANYIDNVLRRRNNFLYTADFLNLLLPKVEGALDSTKEESTKETLTEAVRILKYYRSVSYTLSKTPNIEFNKKKNLYEVPTEEEDNFLLGAINTLKGILSLLKCYLEALKEFLEWVGTPELLPKEFKDMETDLLIRFHDFIPHEHNREKNPDADKFPLFFARNKVAEEYTSIDYMELPPTIDISKENNLFVNYYRNFFKY